jgi:dipeptidyl-peptidase 4
VTPTRPITFRDIAHLPSPGMNTPVDMRFSPDGRLVTYLFSSDGTMSRELWAHDRQTGREWRLLEPEEGSERLTREEELRRERQRQYAGGVTGHAWSETGDTLLVKTGAGALVRRGMTGGFRTIGGGQGVVDPRLNRDGTAVAYVRDGELYTQDLTDTNSEPRRLTFDASAADEYGDRAVTNGLAEFVAQEEMGRSAGFWWSPLGDQIAFEQADSSTIPYYFIVHPGTDDVQIEAHRYPFAGKANARVRLGVVPVTGGEPTWLALGDDPESYLARVNWTPDGQVIAQIQSRDQQRLDLLRFNLATGERRVLWTDRVEPWINLTDDLRFVSRPAAAEEDYRILWSSERDGRRELYLYDRDATACEQISRGDLHIDEVTAVDAAGGWAFVEGWRETPLERHLFRVPLAGGAAEQITRDAGSHRSRLAPDCAAFVDSHHAAGAPPTATVRRMDGSVATRLQPDAPADPRIAELDLPVPEFITVAAGDGTTLHGALYRPRNLATGEKAPVIVDVYGGPHAQQVQNSWGMTVDLRAQRLAQEGFVVLILDNRGSARRGLAFEAPLYGNLGDVEVRDQVAGVRALATLAPEADLDRVGVYGWSYGGYMALMCLARAPEIFKAGVAGAPVTHWDGYDTHYTEQFMGHPDQNPEGYQNSSVMPHVKHITGDLFIIHGMIDENVHFRHTGRLVNALIREGIPHEVLFFPEERHGPRREEDRAFAERRIAEFFDRALRGKRTEREPVVV